MISTQGCQHASVKKKKTEIWFIDAEAAVLFRVTGPGQEQVLQIKDNPKAMNKFMCIDSNEFDFQIEDLENK